MFLKGTIEKIEKKKMKSGEDTTATSGLPLRAAGARTSNKEKWRRRQWSGIIGLG